MARSRTTERRPQRSQFPTPVGPQSDAAHRERRDPQASPQWYTVAQLCERWQLSRKTIYKYIAAELLPVWRIGPHLYRVAAADVVEFETEQKIVPPPR
jgi:excisionase family DNA binding protein